MTVSCRFFYTLHVNTVHSNFIPFSPPHSIFYRTQLGPKRRMSLRISEQKRNNNSLWKIKIFSFQNSKQVNFFYLFVSLKQKIPLTSTTSCPAFAKIRLHITISSCTESKTSWKKRLVLSLANFPAQTFFPGMILWDDGWRSTFPFLSFFLCDTHTPFIFPQMFAICVSSNEPALRNHHCSQNSGKYGKKFKREEKLYRVSSEFNTKENSCGSTRLTWLHNTNQFPFLKITISATPATYATSSIFWNGLKAHTTHQKNW